MTDKAWNQCTECDRFIPCRRHPDADCVGPIPDDDYDSIPPWVRRPDPCADCSGDCEVCDR